MRLVNCLLAAVATTYLLVGCNGNAPLLTCRKPCAYSDEYRDLFCGCQKKIPVTSGGGGTPTPTGTPAFDWSWEEAYGCSINRHYYLLNHNPKKLIIKVSKKIPNSINRSETEYTVDGNTTRREDGVDLSFEEIKVNGDCFDQDFMISSWRLPQHSTAKESVLSALSESKQSLVNRHRISLAKIDSSASISTENVLENSPRAKVTLFNEPNIVQSFREVTPVDCAKICDSGDTINCPIRGYPPDQEKLVELRDKLIAPTAGTNYSTADIYAIFGLAKSACDRTDAKIVSAKIFNRGDYCSFPMVIQEADPKPSIAIHFPQNIKGERLVRGNSSSGLGFLYGTANPLLLFTDEDLSNDFGGTVTEVTASSKGIYYQTAASCIFVGVK